jgi:hypothetical protein
LLTAASDERHSSRNAAMAAPNKLVATPDTLITIKVSYEEVIKKLRLPLRDLTATVLPLRVSLSQQRLR